MKGYLRWIIPLVILLIWLTLLIVNLTVSDLPEFYQASANSLLSSLIVLAVSYWLVQSRIDSRKTDDVITSILNRTENAFSEYSTQVNCMLEEIEGNSPDQINVARQKMLSGKQKLDSHISLLGNMRTSKQYSKDFKSLRGAVKKYHEKVESLSVSANYQIPSQEKNEILRCSNLVSTKFATLYVTINQH